MTKPILVLGLLFSILSLAPESHGVAQDQQTVEDVPIMEMLH